MTFIVPQLVMRLWPFARAILYTAHNKAYHIVGFRRAHVMARLEDLGITSIRGKK